MLPVFNTILQHIDSSSGMSINDGLHRLTETIRNVADPLFSKKNMFIKQITSFHVNKLYKECRMA